MIDINKIEHEHGTRIDIKTDEGTFYIDYGGNLDLYWGYYYQRTIIDEPNEKEFIITKENYYLYSLFMELYDCVKNSKVFYHYSFEEKEYGDDEIAIIEILDNESNQTLAKMEQYNSKRLFINNTIEWHSDDFPYDEGSIFKIEKRKDIFVVTFIRSKVDDIYKTSSVRLRNSGSSHDPFNLVFMRMYNKLVRDYDPNYHQIHIEEYLYKKKTRKKVVDK